MAKTKGGRPTKYKTAYCDELIDFFSEEPYKEVEVTIRYKNGSEEEKTELRPNRLPTFHEFAAQIGVNGDTLVEWAKEENEDKYPGFSAAYKRAKELQKWFLIENGLNNLYQPAFAIFTAKNITDMKDVQRQELTGKDGKDLPAPIYGGSAK